MGNYQQNQAVEHLFAALSDRCPQVLAALRDGGGTDATVARDWASDHHLDCPSVVDYACLLRSQWARSARRAERLGGGRISGVAEFRFPTEAERAWIATAQTDPRNLPQPETESLTEWRARASALYRAREAIQYPAGRAHRPPPARGDKLAQHAEWFAEVQVNGLRPGDLSRRVHVDRTAIERETRRFATLLGLQRRTWPRGRRPR